VDETRQFPVTIKVGRDIDMSVAELLASLLTIRPPDCGCPHNGEAIHDDFGVPPIRLHYTDFVVRNTQLEEYLTERERDILGETSSKPPIKRHRRAGIGKSKQSKKLEYSESPVWRYSATDEQYMRESDWADEDKEDEEDEDFRYHADQEPVEEYYEGEVFLG
jgi:hypothetical protein